MAPHDLKPWWEREGKLPPHDEPVDAEREHLRSELARAWRSHQNQREGYSPRRTAPLPRPR